MLASDEALELRPERRGVELREDGEDILKNERNLCQIAEKNSEIGSASPPRHIFCCPKTAGNEE